MAYATRAQQAAAKRKRNNDINDEEEDVKPIILSSEDEGSASDDSDSDSSEDEDTDEGDDAAGICEYYEAVEQFPAYPAYDKDFSQVSLDLTGIAKTAAKIIDDDGCNGIRVQSCRRSAKALADVPRAKREKIALLGQTGVGKSSLLNSLLDMPDLAKSMAGGQSCTYVGTEYECPFPGQTKKFAAKIEYFSMRDISNLLNKMIQDFFTWTFIRPSDLDAEEMQELQRLCTSAFNTFRALFCDKEEFESQTAGAEWLRSKYAAANKEEALSTLIEWCRELLGENEADESGNIEYTDADTQDELLEQLTPMVTSNSQYETPAVWPLVRKIRYVYHCYGAWSMD